MKKILFALLIISIVSNRLCAQDKIIELTIDSSTIALPIAPFNEIIILDNRIDTSKIGMAQVGAFNKLVPVRFNQPAAIAIQKFIQDLIMRAQADSQQLLINIRKLETFEKTYSFSEKGYFEFAADAYVHKNANLYAKVFSIDTPYTIKGVDVTKAVFRKVANALESMVYQIAASGVSVIDTGNLVSYNEIIWGVRTRWAQFPINTSSYYIKVSQ